MPSQRLFSRTALSDCLCRAQSYIFHEYCKSEFFTKYFLPFLLTLTRFRSCSRIFTVDFEQVFMC